MSKNGNGRATAAIRVAVLAGMFPAVALAGIWDDELYAPKLPEPIDLPGTTTWGITKFAGGRLPSGYSFLGQLGIPINGEFWGDVSHREDAAEKDAASDPCGASSGSGAAAPSARATTGNPVIISTGNKIEPELDFDADGLRLERVWNQHWSGVGLFGYHWLSSFDFKLSFDGSLETGSCYPISGEAECQTGANATAIWAHRPDGRKVRFVKQPDGTFQEDKSGPIARIVRLSDGTWQLHREDNSIERYRKGGLPLEVHNQHGVGLSYTYGGLNGTQVQKVAHTSGREALFTWTGDELTSIKAPGNAVFNYTYSHQKIYTGRHLLASTEQPGVVPVKITYHYEGSGFFRFSGKSINDVRYSWFEYDSERRATLTEHAGGRRSRGALVPEWISRW